MSSPCHGITRPVSFLQCQLTWISQHWELYIATRTWFQLTWSNIKFRRFSSMFSTLILLPWAIISTPPHLKHEHVLVGVKLKFDIAFEELCAISNLHKLLQDSTNASPELLQLLTSPIIVRLMMIRPRFTTHFSDTNYCTFDDDQLAPVYNPCPHLQPNSDTNYCTFDDDQLATVYYTLLTSIIVRLIMISWLVYYTPLTPIMVCLMMISWPQFTTQFWHQ